MPILSFTTGPAGFWCRSGPIRSEKDVGVTGTVADSFGIESKLFCAQIQARRTSDFDQSDGEFEPRGEEVKCRDQCRCTPDLVGLRRQFQAVQNKIRVG